MVGDQHRATARHGQGALVVSASGPLELMRRAVPRITNCGLQGVRAFGPFGSGRRKISQALPPVTRSPSPRRRMAPSPSRIRIMAPSSSASMAQSRPKACTGSRTMDPRRPTQRTAALTQRVRRQRRRTLRPSQAPRRPRKDTTSDGIYAASQSARCGNIASGADPPPPVTCGRRRRHRTYTMRINAACDDGNPLRLRPQRDPADRSVFAPAYSCAWQDLASKAPQRP